MEPFIFRLGPEPWPAGVTALQVYALVDLQAEPRLADLVGKCREVSEEFPITSVEAPWLHVTLEQLTIRPGSEISGAERGALAEALRRRLGGFPAFEVKAGSPVANSAGCLLDLNPDDRLDKLHGEVRAAVHEVFGAESTDYPVLPCHRHNIGYCRGVCDSDAVQSRLRRRVRPGHAPFRVRSVHIVEVSPDHDGKQILWDQDGAVEIPLAAGA